MIEKLTDIPTEILHNQVISGRYPNNFELMEKINELIDWANDLECKLQAETDQQFGL